MTRKTEPGAHETGRGVRRVGGRIGGSLRGLAGSCAVWRLRLWVVARVDGSAVGRLRTVPRVCPPPPSWVQSSQHQTRLLRQSG